MLECNCIAGISHSFAGNPTMASAKRKEEKMKQMLRELVQREDNRVCMDCPTKVFSPLQNRGFFFLVVFLNFRGVFRGPQDKRYWSNQCLVKCSKISRLGPNRMSPSFDKIGE